MRKLALILSILVSFDVSAQLQVVSKSFVTWHGAKGDGITDDTAAFQRGINAAQANGSVLIVPPGIYSLTEVTNTSGITIEGVEGAVLLQATNNLVGLQQTIMWSVISSSTNANLNHTNITFRGLTFKGRVDNDGFYEFSFLLGILGANNVLIEDCSFIGTRGDGIYLASYAGSHNRNITVRNCYFDGVNGQNRQGISIIDCEGLVIENCYFYRHTKTGMPGAIDFEPNSAADIILNATVRNNVFKSCGGSVGIITVALPNDLSVASNNITHGNIIIEGNTISECTNVSGIYVQQYGNNDITSRSLNVTIRNNVVRNIMPFMLQGVRGVNISGNLFSTSDNPAYVGSTFSPVDITIKENTFDAIGTVGLAGSIRIASATNINISDNLFVRTPTPANLASLENTAQIKFNNNTIRDCTFPFVYYSNHTNHDGIMHYNNTSTFTYDIYGTAGVNDAKLLFNATSNSFSYNGNASLDTGKYSTRQDAFFRVVPPASTTNEIFNALHIDYSSQHLTNLNGVAIVFGLRSTNSGINDMTSRIIHYGDSSIGWRSRLQLQSHSATKDVWNSGILLDENGDTTFGADIFADNGYFTNDCSALTFTDRSAAPNTLAEAVDAVNSIKSDGKGSVDHSKLAPILWGKTAVKVAVDEEEKAGQVSARLGGATDLKSQAYEISIEPDSSKRDISMLVSAEAMVIQDLLKRIAALEEYNIRLEERLVKLEQPK